MKRLSSFPISRAFPENYIDLNGHSLDVAHSLSTRITLRDGNFIFLLAFFQRGLLERCQPAFELFFSIRIVFIILRR
jgi:hypothetical protein